MSEFHLAIGWFGVPGGAPSRNPKKVHVVDRGTKRALCGWQPRPELQFQFCAWDDPARTVSDPFEWVDCKTCRLVRNKRIRTQGTSAVLS